MIFKLKKTYYFYIFIIIIFLIIYNWNFLLTTYNYKIYKENCIITKINEKKNNQEKFSQNEALKFCNCKTEKLKKEKTRIFVSKLRVEDEFFEKEKKIDKECKIKLKLSN